jgi:type II secretion system (T2SS) protein C
MPRRLLLVNVLLVGASLASVLYIVYQLTSTPAAPVARPRTAAAPAVSAPPVAVEPPPPPGAYGVVASRNLFSPTRTEAPPAPAASAAAVPPQPKPNLYGVVLREGAPIAYLEDPATKRVAGYRTGDTVAGGTVQTIAADHVVLIRSDGRLEIRLNDPAKPRPPAPPVAATPGAQPGVFQPRGVAQPGVPRLPEGTQQGPGAIAAPQPPSVIQPAPQFPGRRPLPPNLRRVLPGSIPDAAQQ